MINRLFHSQSILSHLTLPKFNFAIQRPTIDKNCNYYDILMVQRTANLPEIKKKYYQLSKKYHPDFQKGYEPQFKQIKAAYEILSNYELRKQYDEMTAQRITSQEEAKVDKQEQHATGPGPYQTQEEYQDYATKGSYNFGKAQWHKVRVGVKRQSYASIQSRMFRKQGAQSDEEIPHYCLKTIQLGQQQRMKNSQNQDEGKIRQRSIQLKKKHLERVERAKKALKQNQSGIFKAIGMKIREWVSKKQP